MIPETCFILVLDLHETFLDPTARKCSETLCHIITSPGEVIHAGQELPLSPAMHPWWSLY